MLLLLLPQIRLIMSKQVRAPLAAKVKAAWVKHFSHIKEEDYEETYRSEPLSFALVLGICLVLTPIKNLCCMMWCASVKVS